MPPASRPTSGDVVGACIRQWVRVADAVDALPVESFHIMTRLPAWRVADLVAHCAMCAAAPAHWLAEPAPAASEPKADAASYLLAVKAAAPDIDARTRDRAAGRTPTTLKADLRAAIDDLEVALATADLAQLIPTRLRPMRLDEFLITRCVEGVVHGRDLDPSVDPDPVALKIAAKALLSALAAKAPGRTVEVRVPPIAAVQCVEGPRHTRGTPSNVVETDAISWVQLATARLTWSDAAGDGRLQASGERSDISGLLPLL